jgi:dienelactone hydrolase
MHGEWHWLGAPGFQGGDEAISRLDSSTAVAKFSYCRFRGEQENPMQTRDVRYGGELGNFLGYLAYNVSGPDKRPGILVVHEGLGLGEHIMERARRIAELGYVVFAADMFGERRQASSLEDMGRLVGGLRADPSMLRARARLALETLASLSEVDATRLAAIGFCFGGSVVLELARDGADLKGVVSVHGVLATKAPAVAGAITASVLICTGADDPLAPADQIAVFENEMRVAGVKDWQVIKYGNTLHAFTNPAANASAMQGALYSEQADRRAWRAVKDFFEERLAGAITQA